MKTKILTGLAALSLLLAGAAQADVIDFSALPDGLAANPLVQPGASLTTLGGGFNVIGIGGLCPAIVATSIGDCSKDLQVDFTTASTPLSLTFVGNNDTTVGDDIGDIALFSGATLLGTVNLIVTDTDAFTKDLVSISGFSSVTRMLVTTTDFGGLIYDDFTFKPGAVGGGVPEPATWALMLVGFGMAGAAMRRRRASLVG
jgi:hypothetical protein